MIGRAALATSFVATWLFLPATADAAAPRIIMVTGPPLESAAFLSDHGENSRFMSAVAAGREIDEGRVIDPKELRARPYLELWLFWGDDLWEPYVRNGRLDALRAEQANQSGRYYPAYEGRPAVISIPLSAVGTRRPTRPALRILAGHDIPARLEAAASRGPDGSPPWLWIGAGASATLLLATAAAVVAQRRRRVRPVG
jgi:hypothetical protein